MISLERGLPWYGHVIMRLLTMPIRKCVDMQINAGCS